jgi:type II secretory pathway pseudopilin PulG
MQASTKKRKAERGFTLLELAIATIVLLVGIVSVVQLIPASISSNSNSRQDTTATVIGQRILEQMALQPLTSTTFTNSDGNSLNLGDPTQPGVAVGSPLVAGTSTIDFSQAVVPGYNLQYVDPSDTNSGIYDVRWTVITTTNGVNTVAKRFIVGTRKVGVNGFQLTATFDTTVSK